jgi:PKD domain
VTGLNPEPYAYETGFGIKWMIQRQINGDPSLRFSGPNAVAPYLCWGPYFWIDGQNRRSDGAIWNCGDLISDFTHPSSSGVYKVSSQLLAFFKTDPTSTPWYLKKTVVGQQPRVTLNGPTTVRAGTRVQFSALANDPDGQIQEFVWSFDDGDYIWSTNNSSAVKTFFVPGTYRVRVTVTDNDGNTATGTLTTTVQ